MKAVIVANGVPENPVFDRTLVPAEALIIAADGGADYCRELGLQPDVIIGDMDSIRQDPDTKPAYQGVDIIRHPVRKDATDLELAIRLALERGADSLIILGALGGRWDMSIGNLLLLTLPELKGIPVRLIDGRCEIAILSGKQATTFHGRPGDTLSLIPAAADATGISLAGLEYPLTNATLPRGTSRGTSNVLTGREARVSLESGSLICVLTRQTPESGL